MRAESKQILNSPVLSTSESASNAIHIERDLQLCFADVLKKITCNWQCFKKKTCRCDTRFKFKQKENLKQLHTSLPFKTVVRHYYDVSSCLAGIGPDIFCLLF